MRRLSLAAAAALCLIVPHTAHGQERPYFVTYDHYVEEPGNLETGLFTTTGIPGRDRSPYHAPWLELEYGVSGWWTTEFYLEGVATNRDGAGFTGWRWENRFRPLKGEHRVNPVLYVEYENVNEASRIQKEVVGSGGIEYEPIALLRAATAREVEGKLILSSAVSNWNIAGNLIFEKNLSDDEGVEFGYSVGVSRPLGALARSTECRVCAESFVVGVEAYGGLGSTVAFGRGDERHYVAPVVAWHVGGRGTLKASFAVGTTGASDRFLIRLGYVREFATRGRK